MDALLKRKLLILPPVFLGLAVLAYQVAFKQPPTQKPPAERVRHVRVIEATATEFVSKAVGYGSVRPARVWNAVAQVSGRIVFVHPDFKKGAILAAGTEIVRISPTDYEIAIRQANANIRSAEAKLKELAVTEENTRGSLEIENRSLGIKKAEFARARKLQRRGSASQATVDQKQVDLLNQRKKVQDLENALRLLPTQKAAQQEQITVFKSQMETAERNLEHTSIKLPFDARIANANVEITRYVGVGTALGAADGMQTAEIEAQVPQSRFRKLVEMMVGGDTNRKGVPANLSQMFEEFGLHAIVRLRFDDRNVEWRGRVVRISDTVDPKTRTVGAIVAVDKAYAGAIPGRRPPLIKGMFVEVELRTKPVGGKILVPRAALHAGRLYLVNDKQRLEIRAVETSLAQDDLAVISAKLTPGEKVIVSDLSPAIAGMALKATTDTEFAKRLRKEAAAKGAVQ